MYPFYRDQWNPFYIIFEHSKHVLESNDNITRRNNNLIKWFSVDHKFLSAYTEYIRKYSSSCYSSPTESIPVSDLKYLLSPNEGFSRLFSLRYDNYEFWKRQCFSNLIVILDGFSTDTNLIVDFGHHRCCRRQLVLMKSNVENPSQF